MTFEARLERIRAFRGCDWFPSWARSPVDYWTAAMPRATAARELGFVRGLGLDHVRVWLSAWGYEQDPALYLENLSFLLDEAQARGLGVVFELFDSCGCEVPADGDLGAEVTIGEIPALAGDDARTAFLSNLGSGGRDILGKPGLVPVHWRGDPIVAVWEGFVPNPGYAWLGDEHWPRWDAYATTVVEHVRDHPALVMLEVMNEPFVSQIGLDIDRRPISRFYTHIYELIRPMTPNVPLSIGAANPEWFAEHEANIGASFDVVSVHSLAGPDALELTIKAASEIAGGRVVYLSEWGYFPGGTDEEQLEEYERLLPILERSGVAWAVSHLIAGYGPFANTAMLYPSGVMRPAAQHLRTFVTAS